MKQNIKSLIRRNTQNKETEYNHIYFEIAGALFKARKRLEEESSENPLIIKSFLQHTRKVIRQYEREFEYESASLKKSKPDFDTICALHQTLKVVKPDVCIPILRGADELGATADFFGYKVLPIEYHSGHITDDRDNNTSNLEELSGDEKILLLEEEINGRDQNRKRTYELVIENIKKGFKGRNLQIEIFLGSIGIPPIVCGTGHRFLREEYKNKSISELKKLLEPIFRIHQDGIFFYHDMYSATVDSEPWRIRLIKELAKSKNPYRLIESFERDMKRETPISDN
ncbi:MAG: hypothetical protein UR15_C0040G0004 [Parcubacteria group bacterium GW2011_GWA2_31_28]|nr:MAG: hypothetical protein UR15_C0040G0004 [Parcubacteria group bacterium GW2011_GWA2_31_28]